MNNEVKCMKNIKFNLGGGVHLLSINNNAPSKAERREDI